MYAHDKSGYVLISYMKAKKINTKAIVFLINSKGKWSASRIERMKAFMAMQYLNLSSINESNTLLLMKE